MTTVLMNNSWGKPKKLMPGLFASSTNEKIIYVTDVLKGSYPMEKADIVRYIKEEDSYIKVELLNTDINTGYHEFHPFIASDERFLIFDSNRPGGFGDYDIYVSFKNNNEWSKPINMGSKINSEGYEGVATVSHDGKYLFFNRNEDIYWVDAKIIEELKPKDLE
ncbi:hypothetical protein ACFLQ3_02000 [Bacteroidota bacterium]